MVKLELNGLTKEFGDFTAVNHINLTMTNGVYGLLGVNGAGKTTLMRMLCTLLKPTSGTICCNGKDIFSMDSEYRKLLGYLPQDFGFYPEFTVEDYLLYIAALKGIRPVVAKKRVKELISKVGLSKAAHKKMKKLSGGMKRRAGIAQAMLNNPKILILDEPTAGLDPNERIRFRNLISELSEDRLVLLSTHIVSDIEYIANEIWLMKDGEILHKGSIDELINSMTETVWECLVPKNRVSDFMEKYKISDKKGIGYSDTFNWSGALKYAAVTKDEKLFQLLQNKFDSLFTTKKQILPKKSHVDWNMFGSLPLEFYWITKEKRYLDLGIPYADTQWEVPENAKAQEKEWDAKGYSWQTRLWIDDMYMITIIQMHAYRATGDMKYVERAAKEMAMYLDELQRLNGLFYHAPDVPYFWGRGNGWMAAGMAEVLRFLPESSPYYSRIIQGFQTMMASLKKYQTEEGMWRQLVDKPDCWIETSGSAMFAYAFIMGVKYGWLPVKEYGEAARRAWLGMVTYINPDGKVREVCVGTNKKNDMQYYYDRRRNTGDYHGQAPYLWCTVALLEK